MFYLVNCETKKDEIVESDHFLPSELVQMLEHELFPGMKRSWNEGYWMKRSPFFNNILSGYWDDENSL